MAVLTDLPTEILELIYHFLGSIDDVHHLGRTCRILGHVTHRRSVYLEIMRSIIYRSPQHRHDYQLSRMICLHKHTVPLASKGRIPATVPPNTELNVYEKKLLEALDEKPSWAALSDVVICHILARYQGLRVLQDIWLERQLETRDYLSTDDELDDKELSDKFDALLARDDEFREGTLPRRCSHTGHTRLYNSLNGDQRARFHAAVVRVWLLNEVRWLLTNFEHPVVFTNQISILERCKEMIAEGQDTPLMDKLDEHAVFAFMYHYLLPRHIMFLAERDSSKLPFTFMADSVKDVAQWSRLFRVCLMAGQVYFQPPDLIDLVVRSRLSRKPPYPRMAMPESSEKWRHPQSTRAVSGLDLYNENAKQLIQQILIRHIQIMNRSSFNQDSLITNPTPSYPSRPRIVSLEVPDYARRYFADQAMLAFEKHQSRQEGLVDIRKVFDGNWVEVQWEIWWWANNDDKARMKMERWRESKGE